MGWMWDVSERQEWRTTLKGLTSGPGELQAGKHEKVAELERGEAGSGETLWGILGLTCH